MGIRIPSGSTNPISFAAIWQNIYEKSGTEYPIPSAFPSTNLQTMSRNIASASTFLRDGEVTQSIGDERHWIAGASSSFQTAGNPSGNGNYYAMDELWGANYQSITIQNITFERSSAAETVFVDGETIQVEYNSDQSTGHTIGLYKDSDNSLIGSTFTNTTNSAGTGSWSNFNGVSLTDIGGAGASGEDYYYKFTINNFNNKLSQRFTHWDTVDVGQISKNLSGTQYIDHQSDTTPIDFGNSMTTGIEKTWAWTFTNATNGDNEKQNNNAAATITSTAAEPTITYTGTGTFGIDLTVGGNPTTARNEDTTGDDETVTINYNRSVSTPGFYTYDNINQGSTARVLVVSRGVQSGTLNVGYDDNQTTSDKDLVDTQTESVSTMLKLETADKTFTMNTPGTFYPAAYHTGDSVKVVGSTSIIVAPTFTYSTTGNKTISVNGSQVFKVLSSPAPVGNNIIITVAQSNFSLTTFNYSTGITVEPTIYNGTYTITYDGDADYSQPNDQAYTLTVNPSVGTITVSPTTGYTIKDSNNVALTVAKHGVAPTTFTTNTPTIIGDTIHSTIWSADGAFALTNGSVTTLAGISGTFADFGTNTITLTVHELQGFGGTTDSNSVTAALTKPIKAFDGNVTITNTDQKLRRGTTYSTSFQCDYVKNVKLQILNSSNVYANITGTVATDIGGDFVDESITKNFTILNTAPLETETLRALKLVDTDYTNNFTTSVQNTAADTIFHIYDGLPLVPTNIVVTNDVGKCHVSWTDGAYNNTNKVRVYSDAGGNTLEEIFFDSNDDNAGTHTLSPDSGTSIISRWFKISGINQTADPEVISSMSSEAKMWPTLAFSRSNNVSLNVGSTGYFNFTAFHGYDFLGTIACSNSNFGDYSSVADTNARAFTPGSANGIYTITFDAVADTEDSSILQSIAAATRTFTVLPIADFTSLGSLSGTTTLYITPPAGSGLSADGLAVTFTGTGTRIDGYEYTITKDNSSLTIYDNPPAGDFTRTGAQVTAAGTGTYNVNLDITGTDGDTDTEYKDNSFTVSNYAAQTIAITGTWDTAGEIRRGDATTITATIGTTPILAVKAYREYMDDQGGWYKQGGDISTDLFGSNTSGAVTADWTIPSTQHLSDELMSGDWGYMRIVLENNTASSVTDHGAGRLIIDGVPIAPSTVAATTGNGSSVVTWSGGAFQGGGFVVLAYQTDGTYISTSSSTTSGYTYPNVGLTTKTRKFAIKCFNLNSFANSGIEDATSGFTGDVSIYPTLAGNHTISDTSIIIYANLVNTTGLTHTFTGNINPLDAAAFSGVTTPLSYSESSGIISLSNTTPAWDATTQATVTSLAVSPYVGDETVTLTVNSNSGQSDTSTCTVHVNFLPKTTNFNEIGEPANGYDQGDNINVTVMWMGFEMGGSGNDKTWVVSVRNTADNTTLVGPVDWLPSSAEAGPQSSGTESGTAVITAPTSNGTYKMLIDKKTGATSNTRFLSTGTFVVLGITQAYINHEYEEPAQEPIDTSFDTSWEAANYTNTTTYRDLVYWQASTGIEEDIELYSTSDAITTRYEPPPRIAGTNNEGWMSYSSFVLLIQKPSGGSPDRGTVKTKLSKRPAAPTIANPTNITSTSMSITVTGDFRVATKVYFSYDNDDGNDMDQHVTTSIPNNQRNSTGSSTTSFTGLSAGEEYTFKCRLENDGPYATKTGIDSAEVQATTTAASWLIVPADFSLVATDPGFMQDPTVTSSNKTYKLSGGNGDTTFTFIYQSGGNILDEQFAVGTSTNPSNWANPGTTRTFSSPANPQYYYMRVRHDWRETLEGNSAVYRITASNSGATDTCDITLSVSSGAGK